MRRFFMTAVLVVAAVLFVAPPEGVAAGKTNLILIFDASGSMWGQIDGKPKIAIAKEAMDLIVGDLPADINIGLVAYGHRRKGDCDDVETLIPLGPLDVKAFMAKVNALNPKGKTPMVRSIRKTADAIKHLEDETTILLVSDGLETCDPDPCSFVAELNKLGIKFVLHVVGFDVGGEAEGQLKCMAKAGGGEYFPAKDAAKLKEALDTVIEKTVEKNLKVSVFLNGKPIGGTVEVTDPATGERVGYRSHSSARPILLGVKPGTYIVTVVDEWQQEGRPRQVFSNVKILETEVRELTVNFGSGTLKIWTYRNGKPFKGQARLSTLDDQTVGGGYATTSPDKPAQYILQPGKYKLMVEDSWGAGTQKDLGVVEIVAGQAIEKKVSFDTGKLVVWTHRGGKPFHASVKVSTMDGKTMGGGWGTTYPDRPETYELEPGQYKVEAEDSWGDPVVKLKFGTVEIKAGQTLNKICDFDSPPSQSGSTSVPAPGTSPTPSASAPGTGQAPVVDSPKQTARETVPQASANPQDMQAMAAQMQAQAQAQAAAAQADATAKMQAAMAGMKGTQLPQSPPTPAQQAAASGQQARPSTATAGTSAPPSGAGAKPTGQPVGGAGAVIGESHVGATAAQPDGGIGDDRPEQGHNPYAGMTKQEMQTAFARDMSMQGPPGGGSAASGQFRVGSPLDTRRHINTLGYRLDACDEKARAAGNHDALGRIETARGNLLYLDSQLKKRVPKEELQRLMDRCAQEVHAIQISLAQGQ